jgi:hypothetical protein
LSSSNSDCISNNRRRTCYCNSSIRFCFPACSPCLKREILRLLVETIQSIFLCSDLNPPTGGAVLGPSGFAVIICTVIDNNAIWTSMPVKNKIPPLKRDNMTLKSQ